MVDLHNMNREQWIASLVETAKRVGANVTETPHGLKVIAMYPGELAKLVEACMPVPVESLERALPAQGEAVAVVTIAGYPQWLVEWLESPGYRYLPEGTKLYTHPAPRVEVDEAMVELALTQWFGATDDSDDSDFDFTWKTVQQQHEDGGEYLRKHMLAALTAALNREAGRG